LGKARAVLHTVLVSTFLFPYFSIMPVSFSMNGVRQLSKSTVPFVSEHRKPRQL
jgi:hypothetical protein